MILAHSTYKPASNWVTVLLLTLVVTGFGLFAQYRVDVGNAAGHVPATLTQTANR